MRLAKLHFIFLTCLMAIAFVSCSQTNPRVTEDFNYNWKFNFGDAPEAFKSDFDDSKWQTLNLPHDWSIEEGYQNRQGTAASTGFVPGGIGWYRKAFKLSPQDKGKRVRILFDGVYNNSSVWINGHFLGKRPYGYAAFSYDLTDHLKFDDTENIIAVKVDHRAYVDSRWYTGSGIYRNVQLIKTSPLHVAQWGVQITTPSVSNDEAEVSVRTKLVNAAGSDPGDVVLKYEIQNQNGKTVASEDISLEADKIESSTAALQVKSPQLWSVDNPNLYTLKLGVMQNGQLVDQVNEMFGIRTFEFDANTGFSLNGKRMKIKGVNLHHDAGAVGAAVPKAIWQYRIGKLKSIGTNAVRMAHNPHSKELMEVCDEMGMLVMNEAFDEWNRPKGKNLAYIGDGAAPKDASVAYPAVFDQWAERDLKDLILRDFNHPSVFMWSIGNEIEWTFPHYSKTYAEVNGADKKYYEFSPNYDSLTIKKAFDKITGGSDPLLAIAQKLSAWVKEVDTTRPVTCGNVLPSIGMASGYGSAVDVLGFNYRATEYDGAHKEYPNLKILGSENWGAYSEWKNSIDRDFVAGIFVWTGFAYLGEAGPWPRKGLNISFFDFAGFKTPRGHFYECLWQDTPKVYTVTTPANESEYSFSEKDGWNFTKQPSPPPVWPRLRDWEWYKVYPKWKYAEDESIIIQTYTNCEEAELFLNGVSLGKQKRADFADDNIIKWLAPYKAGELKVIGYNDGKKATEYSLNTHGSLAKIAIHTNKKELHADGYDVAVVTAKLLDENGLLITDADMEIEFELSGIIKNIGIDNGWEYNVQSHKSNAIKTHEGRAAIFLQAGQEASNATVKVRCGEVVSSDVGIEIR